MRPEDHIYGSFSRVYTVLRVLLEIHHPETIAHGERVARLARSFAQYLGLGTEAKDWIFIAGLVHDLGKLFIPREVLDGEVDLSLADKNHYFYRHPINGAIALRAMYPIPEVLYLVAHHHCENGGRGYPKQQKARILGPSLHCLILADIFDACTSHSGKSVDDALKIITLKGGTGHLTFSLTQAFCRAAMSGLLVHPKLNTIKSLRPQGYRRSLPQI